MKDKQVNASPAPHAIPIISPVLHFLAMPVLVFWRHSFGHSYLRPKSVFLASAFASLLLSFIVFNEPFLKTAFATVAAFSVLVSVLYVIHLILSVRSQVSKTADHDNYSGTSYLLTFWSKPQRIHQERFVHMIAEPALSAILGALAVVTGFGWLGWLLILAGAALAMKEAINGWLNLRRKKGIEDNIEDVEDDMPEVEQPYIPPASAGTRKQRQPRERGGKRDADEQRFADRLQLVPPYTLDAANASYRQLIKDVHPDRHSEDPAANELARELNEAVEYFRARL